MDNSVTEDPNVVLLLDKFESYSGKYHTVYVTAQLRGSRWYVVEDNELICAMAGYETLELARGAWERENEAQAEQRAEVFGS